MDTFFLILSWFKFPFLCFMATFCIGNFGQMLKNSIVEPEEGFWLQFLQIMLMTIFAAGIIWSVTRAVQIII
jgi:hypothetical protein